MELPKFALGSVCQILNWTDYRNLLLCCLPGFTQQLWFRKVGAGLGICFDQHPGRS